MGRRVPHVAQENAERLRTIGCHCKDCRKGCIGGPRGPTPLAHTMDVRIWTSGLGGPSLQGPVCVTMVRARARAQRRRRRAANNAPRARRTRRDSEEPAFSPARRPFRIVAGPRRHRVTSSDILISSFSTAKNVSTRGHCSRASAECGYARAVSPQPRPRRQTVVLCRHCHRRSTARAQLPRRPQQLV